MFNEYPYRNIEDLNLDYLQARVRNLEKIVEQFVALESVTFADPIQWSIASQYAKNVVVLDADGDAFISIKPVPTGVYLNNGEYWLEIFNFMDYVKSFNANLTFNIESDTNRASIAYSVGDWLLLDDVLYKVLIAIPADGLFEIGVNIEHFTVEDFIKAWINYANGLIVQYKNDIDASELAYRNQLAGDIANTTSSLQAQLDAAISGATVDSEVINARVGAFDETYSTLGDAIRYQIAFINAIVEGYKQQDAGVYALPINWEFGYYSAAGVKNASTSWIRSNTKYKITDKYAYVDVGATPVVKVTIVDITNGTNSGELSANQYYSFTVGHEYVFNARLISSGTLSPSDGDTVNIDFYPKYVTIGEVVTQNNYSTVLPDANDAPVNSHFKIVYTLANPNYPANLPDLTNERTKQTFIADLVTTAQYKNNAYYCTQTLTTFNAIYKRYKSLMSGTWSAWTSSQDTNSHQFILQVTDSNISTVLPDLDGALPNTYYLLYITQGNDPLNSPETIATTSIILVHTYGRDTYRVQMYQRAGNVFYRNYVNGVWTVWRDVSKPFTYTVGSSGADYTSLVECIEEAIKFPHSTIYVQEGTYDIIAEYSALHPLDWETRNDSRGVNLQNDLTIIFSSGAKVVANYTGSNPDILTNFSVFNMRYGSATLINATIEASNIRYCIHDDYWRSATSYHNKYAGCKMTIDNSLNSERSKYPHCIGGGFGQNGDTVIENCIFKGIGGDGNTYPAPDDDSIVSYHNGPNASQYSRLSLTGCYFADTGTFRAMSNGTEATKSDLIVSNNSLGSAIIETFVSGANTPNMNVIAFNNEIR